LFFFKIQKKLKSTKNHLFVSGATKNAPKAIQTSFVLSNSNENGLKSYSVIHRQIYYDSLSTKIFGTSPQLKLKTIYIRSVDKKTKSNMLPKWTRCKKMSIQRI
jgi:hypothetical protein